MKKRLFAVVLSLSAVALAFGQSSFDKAQELFLQNMPQEAVAQLEIAIADDPSNVVAFLYLGIAYEQLEMLNEAVTVYRQALGKAGDLKANVANNLANVFFKQGNAEDAQAMYTQAISADGGFAPAYLGRANSRLQSGKLKEALGDYEQYMELEPDSAQGASITQLISLVRTEVSGQHETDAEQAARLARIEAERQRLAAEEMAKRPALNRP